MWVYYSHGIRWIVKPWMYYEINVLDEFELDDEKRNLNEFNFAWNKNYDGS